MVAFEAEVDADFVDGIVRLFNESINACMNFIIQLQQQMERMNFAHFTYRYRYDASK